ncbi:MAG: hypothetical protein KBT01_00500 [Clostridiales bacterium]|nr:hypothetical protein [Candidatus Blautia equi]
MKKLLVTCLCLILALPLSGCAAGDLVDKLTNIHGDENDLSEIKPRVYMDELKGILLDFSGNIVTMDVNGKIYYFDVSEATLECKNGMISGDEISIIYEGKLPEDSTDTSVVRTLKVVNDFHNPMLLEEQVATGTIQDISANMITIVDESNIAATYQLTGVETCFSYGLARGRSVAIHYYGRPGEPIDGSQKTLNATHLKVISISDTDPFKAPAPQKKEKTDHDIGQFRATIQSLSNDILTVVLSNSTTLALDVSDAPIYLQGGSAPGTVVTVTYSGVFDGSTSQGIYIHQVYAAVPKKEKKIASYVAGTIMAKTANTLTFRTKDNAVITCYTENVKNLTTGGLEIGDVIKVIFNPLENKSSNILTCMTFMDAE